MKFVFAIGFLMLPATLSAQEARFISMLGSNSLAVETFTLNARDLRGQLVPQMGGRVIYTADVADGRVRALRIQTFRGTDTIPALSQTHTFAGDTVPFVNLSFALVEVATRRLVASRQDTAHFPVQVIGGPVLPAVLRRLSADSMELSLGGGAPLALTIDAEGRILRGGMSSQGLAFFRTGTEAGGPTPVK